MYTRIKCIRPPTSITTHSHSGWHFRHGWSALVFGQEKDKGVVVVVVVVVVAGSKKRLIKATNQGIRKGREKGKGWDGIMRQR